MKKIFFIIFCVLLLTACAPATQTAYVNGQPVDPFVNAEMARRTAESAQQEADFFNSQLTATEQSRLDLAQTPIAKMTQDMAAFQMDQLHSQATTTAAVYTQQAAITITAQSWSPTPDATQTAVFANSYAEATKIANTITLDNQRVERARTTNMIRAASAYVIGFIVLIIVTMFAVVFAKRFSFIPNPVDERGKAHPMLNVIEAVSWDIERAVNGVVVANKSFIKQLPAITADRQDKVTAQSQHVDFNTRVARLPKALTDAQGMKFMNDPVVDEPTISELNAATLALPPWNFIESWKGESRPLGLGVKGLIVAKAASTHLLVSGITGSGKTGFMLRTQVTASLAKGYQVVNLGFSDAGFGVFADHPNYHSIKLEQASDIIPCLASVYKELKERKQIIGGESYEWDHWPNGIPPRPFVEILIDELGNFAEDIYTSEETSKEGHAKTKELWRWISMIANEGRKVGIRFVAALQDPTAKSVDLRFRRNCTLVSFQQGDASQSSAFIGATGAQLLGVGHFMTRIDGLVIGGGFSPTDPEIKDYLNRHSVAQTPAPNWIDGKLIEPKQIAHKDNGLLEDAPFIVPTDTKLHADEARRLAGEEIRIEEMISQNMSVSAIVREIWGVSGGGSYAPLADRVKKVLESKRTSSSQQMPQNGLSTAI